MLAALLGHKSHITQQMVLSLIREKSKRIFLLDYRRAELYPPFWLVLSCTFP